MTRAVPEPSVGPGRVPDLGVGPVPVPGTAHELLPQLVRLTAPNPGFMTGPGTNTYLVGRDELAVVDPGPDDQRHRRAILDEVARRRATVRWVVVTHSHPDHAPGARALAAATGAATIGFGHRAAGFEPDRPVDEGWVLDGGSFSLRAVHTPGHASEHLCWLLEEPSVLLSGDHVMHGSTVVIRPPDGDMAEYLTSLRRVLDLDPVLSAIAPGHGRLIGDPTAAVEAIVAHRLEREQLVAAALTGAGTASVDQILGDVYPDVAEPLLPVARMSLWAHLRKLEDDGRVSSTLDGELRSTDPEAELSAPWTA